MRHMTLAIVLLMSMATLSTGCLGLVLQREIMEDMREPPETILREQAIGFDHTFTSTGLDSTDYYNESSIQIDSSVQSMSISFRAQMPLSETFESLIGNETNLIRYVDAKLWSPGSKSAGSEPFWEIRVTQDHSLERWDYTGMNFQEGIWILEVDARGYGWEPGIEQLTAKDHFDVFVTITKPCIRFAEIHDSDDCIFQSELN